MSAWRPDLDAQEAEHVQALHLEASGESQGSAAGTPRFHNTALLAAPHRLVLLINARPSQGARGPSALYALRYSTSSDGAFAFDAVSEFQVAQPVFSAVASSSAEKVEIHAVQPVGIQQHLLDPALCVPAKVTQ